MNKSNPSQTTAGFTLVEILVTATIIIALMGILISMTDQTQRLMRSTSAKVEQFQEARVAFEAMTRRLAQATLNTYWDYLRDANDRPLSYQRSAELRFISGITKNLTGGVGANGRTRPGHAVFFHTPSGFVDDLNTFGSLDHLINVAGYFVEIGTDEDTLPPFLRGVIDSRKRFRLMELMQPSERLMTYKDQNPNQSSANSKDWFKSLVTDNNRPVRVLAENVIALIILPRLSKADEQQWMKLKGKSTIPILAPKYSYDTLDATNTDPLLNPRNQLPPVIQVAMVAIDEPSARRLEDLAGSDINLGVDYSRIFTEPSLLEDNPSTSAPNDGDLSQLETLLINKKIAYRIFATNVSVRGAKWSRSQVR